MKNTKYEFIGIAILLIGSFVIFKKVKEAKDLANSNRNTSPEVDNQKESDIDTIVNAGKFSGLRSILQTFEPAYLKDWARAVLNNQTQFTSKSVKYNTQGGTRMSAKKVTAPKTQSNEPMIPQHHF